MSGALYLSFTVQESVVNVEPASCIPSRDGKREHEEFFVYFGVRGLTLADSTAWVQNPAEVCVSLSVCVRPNGRLHDCTPDWHEW